MIKYKCAKCDFSGSFMSERKKCPCCNKQALYIPDEEEEIIPQKKTSEKIKKVNPKAAIFKENKFVDTGKLFQIDRELTKVLNENNSPSERNRKNHIKTAVCSRCNKEFRQFASEYLCNSCGKG
jgi:Zn finger protein HypA/HybF involved in hydrogenase expression